MFFFVFSVVLCVFFSLNTCHYLNIIQRHETVLYLLLYGDWGSDHVLGFFPV